MVRTPSAVIPWFAVGEELPDLAWEACPGKGVDYPRLYQQHFGKMPLDPRLGHTDRVWTGYTTDSSIRAVASSGGILSRVLIYLLETGRVDAVICVKQGVPTPETASWVIASTPEQIMACAQSVYVPVSTLDVLRELEPDRRYAITCLPEQSAALRVLQHAGDSRARQIEYILGPYTGTALEPGAIRSLLRNKGVEKDDAIASLKWRAGEWPGSLEIVLNSGRKILSKKVYYNYLIPFWITTTSLQSMDFANEFTDLSVGDAWSPSFEALGQGFSVVATRTSKMTTILQEMEDKGLVSLNAVDPLAASGMHGHMIDFKKRGGYLRNRWRAWVTGTAPDYGIRPQPIGVVRLMVEVVICSIFSVCRLSWVRGLLERVPERLLGPLFNQLRLAWKGLSKPAKRRGLGELKITPATPLWRERPL